MRPDDENEHRFRRFKKNDGRRTGNKEFQTGVMEMDEILSYNHDGGYVLMLMELKVVF